MKIFLRHYDGEDKMTETACDNLKQAQQAKTINDKIHLCYHDEQPVKPCRLI